MSWGLGNRSFEPGPKAEAESAPEAETLAGSEAKEEAYALEEGMADAAAAVVGIEFGGARVWTVR